ncbi:uncharacterized protein LOC105188883 isoform X2 [Harpegnathos saltator]|uniref:uncharacterized protein LOC105188883 isoform X2 n=1 Tax=Harpegnathos saltator TaxID=610380 RepID=UPI00058D62B1|nr:uncharacterized protein LOC105188883 isoform X2 [Harpegnathos saltator]
MSVTMMNFAQEFSNLVIRYTKDRLPPLSSEKNESTNVPLTKEEVTNVVSNVLATLLGISDINVNNTSVKVPIVGADDIAPITPLLDNSDRNGKNENICRFRSQNIQETPKNFGTSSPNLKNDETKTTSTTLEVFQEGKKFISRSSPAICVTNISRSDTFVFEENQTAETTIDLKKLNNSFAKAEVTSTFLQSLDEARMSAINVVTKLNDMKELSQSLNTRRFSTSEIISSRASKLAIPAKVRRSISDFPATPTSSRSLATGSQDTATGSQDRRKSGAVSVDAGSRKLSISAASVSRSVSNLHFPSSNKSSDSTINKPAKNPKYAHIQSTIPKPISSKRRAQ